MSTNLDLPTVAQESVSLPERRSITLKINGAEKHLNVAPWTSLLDLLREHLNLTGTKKGCGRGQRQRRIPCNRKARSRLADYAG